MIKILVVSGSPVIESSTDILLRHIAEGLVGSLKGKCESEVSFVKLNSILFRSCQACGVDPTPHWCFYEDLAPELEKLAACDCLLFGSPIYFDTVSAQAKAFIDRCNCFRPADFESETGTRFIRRLKRTRPGAMVLVGGKDGHFEGARRVIAGFFKWVEVSNEGVLIYSPPDNMEKGSAAQDSAILAKAAELGKDLATLLLRQSEE
ncbi:MAG: flavodoxin family protein [Candidatus Zixiibacteriota bacterium]|nr:MAG: flavodoxin family protein [candidate division Zixibacteria bacterium]